MELVTPPKPAVLYSSLEGVAVQSGFAAVEVVVEVEVLGRVVKVDEVVGDTSTEVDGVDDGTNGARVEVDESQGQTTTVSVVVMVDVVPTPRRRWLS